MFPDRHIGTMQRLSSLRRSLDHIEHEAKIDDFGRLQRDVGREVRVPSMGGHAGRRQDIDVMSAPAAIIEHRRRSVEESPSRKRLHRGGQPIAHNRRAVPCDNDRSRTSIGRRP